jgi:hypothetical protein
MNTEIEFEYSFILSRQDGELVEGGSTLELELEDEEDLETIDIYSIAFDSVLEELYIQMDELGENETPDITISIRNLTWGGSGN